MIDAHIHLENGPYTKEWIEQFIQYAKKRQISEIYLLEHTHIFSECEALYSEMSHFNQYQAQWYAKKKEKAKPIQKYIGFVEKMKQEDFPIKIKFGLEVCYSPEREKDIEKIRRVYDFDFLVGSIHFIDGWAFSHKKQPWKKEEVDISKLYQRYYDLMHQLVKSKLFTGLAHPNSLQCFGAYPEGDFTNEYQRIADALKENDMYIEESSGLRINYGDEQLGMNDSMRREMKKTGVRILTASDAHMPESVGIMISKMDNRINGFTYEKSV